jgi:hypothetical protein
MFRQFVFDPAFQLHQLAVTGQADVLEREMKAAKKDLAHLARDKNGWSILMCAAYGGHLSVVRLLLKQSNVDFSEANADGFTAAHYMAAWSAFLTGGADAKSLTATQYDKAFRQLLPSMKKVPVRRRLVCA